LILSCDPGITGAFCFNDWSTGRFEIVPMPVQKREIRGRAKRTIIDEAEVLSTLQAFAAMGATHLFIEQVQGLPGQSAPAAFNFGMGYGIVRMAARAAGLAIEAVPPALWKAELRVPKDKRAARGRASEMLPMLAHLWPMQKDDGKAEAAMLSLYGERWIKGGVRRTRTAEEQEDVEQARRNREAAAERKAAAKLARTASAVASQEASR